MNRLYLYRGHICLGLSVLWAGICALLAYAASQYGGRGDAVMLLLLGGAMLSGIAALLLATSAYTQWVPKWERHEKLTGHIPGEREKK